MARIFVYDNREFPDFDPARTIEQIQHRMADSFPELANATYSQTKRGSDTVITFNKRVGTKGQSDTDTIDSILNTIHQLPEQRSMLTDIALQHLTEDGNLDMAAINQHPNLDCALSHARDTIALTQQIRHSLQELTE